MRTSLMRRNLKRASRSRSSPLRVIPPRLQPFSRSTSSIERIVPEAPTACFQPRPR